jgi:phenylacetate-CoA ligase
MIVMQMQKELIERLLYPSMERFRGNQVRSILRALQESQFQNAGAVQRERLEKLLLHCRAHVPAYAGRLPEEEKIREDPFQALRRSMPLTKAEFQRDPASFLADNISPKQYIPNCTGGSTGEPVRFFMTRRQVETYEAARWRGLSWFGITPGSRSVMLWGSPIELSRQTQRRQQLRDRVLKNRQILSAYQLQEGKAAEYLAWMAAYRPEYLYGYATILTAFAQMIARQKEAVPFQLKAVVSTSETLEFWQKELLQKVFHCPVANEYGARDAGILAYSCPCGSLHITSENCVLEALDLQTGQPLPPGESGLLAVTDLNNFAQPRLRYLLGDVGAISAQSCPCGRSLPVLSCVSGREDDLLIGRGGVYVHGNVVGQILRPMEGLRAFQFRQHSPQEATLFLVKSGENARIDEAEIRAQFAKALPDTRVQISYVPAIEPSRSGKTRYAVREFEWDGQQGRKEPGIR